MFRHRYRYIFILVLALYTFLNTVICEVYHYFGIDIEWYYALLTISAITFFIWEGNRLVEPLVYKRFESHRNKIYFLVSFFLAGVGISMTATVGIVSLVGNVFHSYTWEQNLNPLKLNIIYAGLVNLLFHLLHAIFFFFQEYKRHWAEAEQLRKVSTQAQIQLVKSQINPHFLFNNLNVLSGMVIRENPDANHFIEEFAKVYRYVLNNQDKELVELKSELDFIQPYLFLLRKRFDSGLHVNIDIPPQYLRHYVIPIALQMLIENAIKHNIVSRSKPLYIDIHANGNQTLVVRNNLQPRQVPEPSSQIGLKNIQQRYELISGRDVIIRQTHEVFEVSLPLISLN